MKEELEVVVEILNKTVMSKAEHYAVNMAIRKIAKTLEDLEKPTENEIKEEKA